MPPGLVALILGLAAVLMASPAQACPNKRHFTTKAKYRLVCDLETSLPFTVGDRRIWGDHIAFFAKEQPIHKRTRTKMGLVFTGTGQPFATPAQSLAVTEKIGRLSACKLVSHSYTPGEPTRVEYACKLAN